MADIEQLRVYQINKLIADSGGDIDSESTLDEVITYLLAEKDFVCPQCAGSGTIDTDEDEEDETVCPTCSGDGQTDVAYKADRNSIIYVPVE